MRTLFAILIVLSLGSCGVLKKRTNTSERIVRDSVIVTNTVHIDTLLIKRDTFSGNVPFDILKQLGEVTFRGDRTTTKIFYRDGNIGFRTDSDSLMQLLLQRMNSIESYKSVSSSNETHVEVKKKQNWGVFIAILILILLILLAAYLLILKIKR